MLLVQREQPPLSVGREATSMSDQSRRIVVGDVPAVHQGPDGRTDDAGRLWPAFSGLCSQPGTGTASSWSAGLWCGALATSRTGPQRRSSPRGSGRQFRAKTNQSPGPGAAWSCSFARPHGQLNLAPPPQDRTHGRQRRPSFLPLRRMCTDPGLLRLETLSMLLSRAATGFL